MTNSESTIRKKMTTGTCTFTYSENSKRAYKNKEKIESFKLDKSNAVSIGMTAIKPHFLYAQ